MTSLEQRLGILEARPALFGGAEERHRAAIFQHFAVINRFEGLIPSAVDERLFQLLATGKISKEEYLDLCLADARGTF